MKKNPGILKGFRNQRGAVLVYVALSLVILLAFTALAIDIGSAMIVRNELANAADAASLAAVRYIGETYESLTREEILNYTFTRDEIVDVAASNGLPNAMINTAANEDVTILDQDVFIGKWDAEAKTMYDVNNLTAPDAVRVIARRDNVVNGPVSTFLAGIIGINATNVTAEATAALTSNSSAGEGGPILPIGISRKWFETGGCDQPIKFNPTGDLEGCAGWNVYSDWPANNAALRAILEGLVSDPPTYTIPETTAYVTDYSFTGGNLGEQAFNAFEALFDIMKVKNDGIWDNDLDPNTWTTRVAVYDRDDCSNPNQAETIVGFATATITNVIGPPDMIIDAIVLCNNVEEGRGGGGNFGTKGSIPGLVQ